MLYSQSMKYLKTGFVTLLITFICVAGYPSAAMAAKVSKETPLTVSASDEKKLLDATVNLYCRVKVGNKEVSTTGTGVVIDARGVILTNAHVAQFFLLNGENSKLNANCSVRIGSPAKEKYTAKLLYISQNWIATNTKKTAKETAKGTGEDDFALLYITEAKKGKVPAQFPFLPVGLTVPTTKGSEVTASGYPASGLKFKDIRSKLKVLVATSTISNLQSYKGSTADVMSISRTKLASSGVSGGPVMLLNSVVGIVATRSTSNNKEGASVRAITVSYINRAFMAETGLSLTALLSGDLADRAKQTEAGISTKALSAIEKPLRVLR